MNRVHTLIASTLLAICGFGHAGELAIIGQRSLELQFIGKGPLSRRWPLHALMKIDPGSKQGSGSR